MLDEPQTGHRTEQQCPSTFDVSPYEIVDTVRNFIDLGLRLDKQRTYQGLGHETLMTATPAVVSAAATSAAVVFDLAALSVMRRL